MKHTKGPWKQSLTAVTDAVGHIIANCAVFGIGKKRAFANARLIAAAPDLLAALEKVLGLMEPDVGCTCGAHETVNPILKAAIAKARGES